MKLFKNIFLVLFFVGFSVHFSSQPRTADKIFSSESKILVISGHPNLEKSKANKAILKELENTSENKSASAVWISSIPTIKSM